MKIGFHLNSRPLEAECQPGLTLLEYLRGVGLYSAKHGCDHGECGSCTVLVDGLAMNSCLLLMHSLRGKRIETLEGLEIKGGLTPIQRAFLDEGAAQCGYCTPGMILSIEALYRHSPGPGEAEIRDALAGNLCRCTGYVKPVQAAARLAGKEKS